MRATFLPLALLLALASFGFSQTTYTEGNWSYTLNDANEAAIVRYHGPGGSITIPSAVGGKVVKAVGVVNGQGEGNWAVFPGVWTSMTSVTIPASVTAIGIFAFYNCSALTSVAIPPSVALIDGAAFYGCSNLRSIVLPNSVITIGQNAFRYCGLTGVAIPNSVTSIGPSAFANSPNLSSVIMGSGLTNVGSYAFGGSEKLRALYFRGNAPAADLTLFGGITNIGTVFYRGGTSGWQSTFSGWPTKIFDPTLAPLATVVSNGGTTLTWDPAATGPANVEHSTDLSGWTTISTNNSTGSFQHAFGNATKGFYRLRWTPSTQPPPNMALIPAGSFEMGNALAGPTDGELPVHTVNVSAFHMDKYEVTKALWDEVANWAATNGYDIGAFSVFGKATNHPVHTATWFEAVKWCNARSQKEGLTPCYTVGGAVMKTGASAPECNFAANGYRLPTEAEWEKAARGGLIGKLFPWGDTISHSQANYNVFLNGTSNYFNYDVSPTSGYHPTYATGDSPYSSPVGSFAPNAYGLYDMAGNMSEWCWDWADKAYYTISPSSDPRGPASGIYRVFRGGSWDNLASLARVGSRNAYEPGYSYLSIGFRCVRSVAP